MKNSGKIRQTLLLVQKNLRSVLTTGRRTGYFACIADGINVSDTGEHRPGLPHSTKRGSSTRLLKPVSPKQDIREIARKYGLSVLEETICCLPFIPDSLRG